MAPSPSERRPVSNLLGLAVLTYLTQRPMHAYELHRQLKDNDAATTFRLSYGALYSVVRQLLESELIAEAGSGQTGKLPKHTRYAVTDAGRAEIDSWMRELLAEPRHEYPAFAAALALIVVLRPDDVCHLLDARLGRLAALRSAIVEQRDATVGRGVHAVFLVEDDYRVAVLDAEAGFVRDLLSKIKDPDSGWAGPWDSYHSGGAGQGEDR